LLKHANKADEKITLEAVKEKYKDDDMEEDRVRNAFRYDKTEALVLKGLGQVKTGDLDAGLASYQAASEMIKKNFLGVYYGDLNEMWTEALTKKEDWPKIMEILAPDTLLTGDDKALATYKKAYLSNGGKEAKFEDHLKETWNQVTRRVPDFEAYSYDGKKVSFSDLKSEVTLLAFWFPT
jgi:hypothetical protein